nr:alpha/beta hydrolase 1 [Phlegmariurus tetrastichus]
MAFPCDNTVEVVHDLLGVKILKNGTVDRTHHDQIFPTSAARMTVSDADESCGFTSARAASKDVVIDPRTGLWVRIFLPACKLTHHLSEAHSCNFTTPQPRLCTDESNKKLPVFLYFHGGGFVAASASSTLFHDFCSTISAKLRVIVVSVDYRLTPEHPLPAAFDDGFAALKWVFLQLTRSERKGEAEPWLSLHGDLSQIILFGHSSGSTIAHHVAIKVADRDDNCDIPLHIISGIIMEVPFFGGRDRTESEKRDALVDGVSQMLLSDGFWAASLPRGADRSHPFCDFTSTAAPNLNRLSLPPLLIIVGALDPYYDRQMQYVELLKEAGQSVTLFDYQQYGHWIFFPEMEERDRDEAYTRLTNFLAGLSAKENICV